MSTNLAAKPATQPTAAALAFAAECTDLFPRLYGRWLDERGYEAIGEYQAPLDPIAKKCGVQIIKMTTKPFGCQFTAEGKTFLLFCKIGTYGYKRIA